MRSRFRCRSRRAATRRGRSRGSARAAGLPRLDSSEMKRVRDSFRRRPRARCERIRDSSADATAADPRDPRSVRRERRPEPSRRADASRRIRARRDAFATAADRARAAVDRKRTSWEPRRRPGRGARSASARPPVTVDEVGATAVKIARTTRRESAPKLIASRGIIAKAPIDTRAAFVLSLVDGRNTVDAIVDMSGMLEDEVKAILERLARLGLISLPEDSAEPPRPSLPDGDQRKSFASAKACFQAAGIRRKSPATGVLQARFEPAPSRRPLMPTFKLDGKDIPFETGDTHHPRRPPRRGSTSRTTAGTRASASRPTAACASSRSMPPPGQRRDDARHPRVGSRTRTTTRRDRSRSSSPPASMAARRGHGGPQRDSSQHVAEARSRGAGVPAPQPPRRLPDLRSGRRVPAAGLLARAPAHAEAHARRAGAQAEGRRLRPDHRLRRRALHHVHALRPLHATRSRRIRCSTCASAAT